MAVPVTPLDQAIDRLVFETQYVRDVLHVAGPSGGITSISTVSLQRLFEGLSWSIDVLRTVQAAQPITTPPVVNLPAVGGTPAPPAGG